jgi:hypothetical protein
MGGKMIVFGISEELPIGEWRLTFTKNIFILYGPKRAMSLKNKDINVVMNSSYLHHYNLDYHRKSIRVFNDPFSIHYQIMSAYTWTPEDTKHFNGIAR